MSADYGPLSRLLHRLALGSRAIAETSFDLEQARRRLEVEAIVASQHVFVAGLARAGTTILLRRLHATGAFRSLTYRDMPFVLMPNLWRRLSGGLRSKKSHHERPHGDGIMVDLESPEALEEVFWRIFAGHRWLRADHLVPMVADEELIARFRSYVAAILDEPDRETPRRYLSKNNNNILRLGSIRAAFPEATLIVPYRDPLQHATSLLAQHRRFRARDARDPFTRRYMRWLGHHEFGADHRRFRFRDAPPTFTDPDDLDYWIELWAEAYEWLLETSPDDVVFLGYDRFASDPDREWPRLAERLGIDADVSGADPLERRTRAVAGPRDPTLYDRARAIHERLHRAAT